jgi:hypothetical protein
VGREDGIVFVQNYAGYPGPHVSGYRINCR